MKTIQIDNRPTFQGDLMIRRIGAVPTDTTEDTSAEAKIVAHSETGHHHMLDGDVRMFRRSGDSMVAYAECRSAVQLKHLRDFDTHETLEFSAGAGAGFAESFIIECRRQREHTPEGWRRVAD